MSKLKTFSKKVKKINCCCGTIVKSPLKLVPKKYFQTFQKFWILLVIELVSYAGWDLHMVAREYSRFHVTVCPGHLSPPPVLVGPLRHLYDVIAVELQLAGFLLPEVVQRSHFEALLWNFIFVQILAAVWMQSLKLINIQFT